MEFISPSSSREGAVTLLLHYGEVHSRHDRSTSYRSAPRTLETKDSQRALRHLKIAECPNLVSFLEGGLAVPDLRRLELEGCINLKSLPGNMHSLLPSLEELELI